MSAPVIPSGGRGTVNRKWTPEVNTGTVGSPVWEPVGYVNNCVPNVDDANWTRSDTFGDGGYHAQDKTGAGWSVVMTLMRKTASDDPTNYDAAQEYLRGKAIGKFGGANQVQIRIFEFDVNDTDGTESPRVEAYMGFGGVQWAEQGGDGDAESTVQVTINSQSKLSQITHPYPATAAVPVIDSASPLALPTAGGTIVHISGHGFATVTGATGVKFIAANAAAYTVESDDLIIAVAPAHAAGSGNVIVTNPTGPSTTGPVVTYS